SPDGASTVNERLSRDRCSAIAEYIESHAGVNNGLVEKLPEGIGWNELERLVEEHPEVPSKEEVIRIIKKTPIWVFDSSGKIIGGRKKQLMELNGGRPYRWLLRNLFPLLRNGVGVILTLKAGQEDRKTVADTLEIALERNDSVQESVKEEVTEIEYFTPDTPVIIEKSEIKRHHFALKTNLLYDAILMPNLEFEWLINPKWSVSLEGDVAWWKPSERKVYRLAIISPEARYHIKPRGLWHGMYVGAFVGGGLYQLENGGNGYRGEGGMGGFSFGYMWPLGKHFFMEAALGAGYMRTVYKVYDYREEHRVYLRTKSLNYFGPLKLKLSIAWRFDIKTKNKKVSSIL
ncbi:MAG: DUF3575 domain-containing protein, partial [Muribaculaceae bacterium]|nr:DUF3575 domain-containing protein [Muribaculaceae bacterium]